MATVITGPALSTGPLASAPATSALPPSWPCMGPSPKGLSPTPEDPECSVSACTTDRPVRPWLPGV